MAGIYTDLERIVPLLAEMTGGLEHPDGSIHGQMDVWHQRPGRVQVRMGRTSVHTPLKLTRAGTGLAPTYLSSKPQRT